MPRFHQRFTTELPGDAEGGAFPREVRGALWSGVLPTRVSAPRRVAHSDELARQLGLGPEFFESEGATDVLAGNALWEGMRPYAANYGGHQFGQWAGQLGDGRAIVLGELEAPDGKVYELQLKGAGRTPYSRRGDGRAVLRSSIREFLCSEAMHHLGVPTTRALSLVVTGEPVVRDMFYDGHPAEEPGAIVCRVAPSFLRFGNFELCAARGELTLLRSLAEHTLRHHFPQLGPPSKESFAALLEEVARRTAKLIAHWQAVGFVHGVMNTDNMSMLGLTLDYGPYGWVNDFDPDWTPNTTDALHRRYRFGAQAQIGAWNLERLAVAFLPLLEQDESLAVGALAAYARTFETEWEMRLASKLGLCALEREDDRELAFTLLEWLRAQETDWTLFFRNLSQVARAPVLPEGFPEPLAAAFYGVPGGAHLADGLGWVRRWWRRTREEPKPPNAVASGMDAVNPCYVLRNHLAQEAIDAAHAGDDRGVHALLDVMRRPYDEQPGRASYAAKRPEWARHRPGCSALSCSS